MGSQWGTALADQQKVPYSCKMKVFAVLLLASYALAHGGDNQDMFKTWSKTKAMESCWGEDNMKVYTVNMKKAVAKCNRVDAPELESNKFEQLYKMMSVINEEHYDRKNQHNRRY